MFYFTGSVPLHLLRRRWIENAVSKSTRRLRERHWRVYVDFCREYKLPVFPCTVSQAADYISLLGVFMKYSSVITYYQAVLYMYRLLGYVAPPLCNPLVKSVLAGILNKKHGGSVKKDPFTPGLLFKVYKVVDLSSHVELLAWIGLLLMFRSLLRISHVVNSPHTLCRGDVVFFSWGVIIKIRSSKSRHEIIPEFEIPICAGENHSLCPVWWLKLLVKEYPRAVGDYLFSTCEVPVFSYSSFRKTFKNFCIRAGIVGNFASHSLRRGGATFMSKIGLSVTEIKDRGLWSSNIVFDYIKPSVEHRKEVDKIFSSSFCDLGRFGE